MNKRSWGQIQCLLVTLGIVLSNQNCSSNVFFSAGGTSGLQALRLNNGETYDGKLNGTYYRMVPDYQCENSPAPLGVLKVEGPLATLTLNHREKCGHEIRKVRTADLATSPYFSGVVGFMEGAYERRAEVPDFATDSRLLESWCRWDTRADEGLDVVIKYDYESRVSSARMINGKLDTQTQAWTASESPSIDVKRDLTLNPTEKNVVYSSSGFHLRVELQQQAEGRVGLYAGRLRTKLGDREYDEPVHCRMGGGLDGRGFRLQFSGKSSNLAPASDRVLTEIDPPWQLQGQCDVLLGDVRVFGEGLIAPFIVPCRPDGGGTFSAILNYDAGAQVLTASVGGKRLRASQIPALSEPTTLFKADSSMPLTFVSNAMELQAIPVNVVGLYILTNDIDLVREVSPSNNFRPIGSVADGPFAGLFEGDDKLISGLSIDASSLSSNEGVGLFGYLRGPYARVQNVRLENVNVSNPTGDKTGAVVGQLMEAIVENVSALNVDINGRTDVGGLVGMNWLGEIRSSSVMGFVYGATGVGGLVGHVRAGGISESYAISDVIGSQRVGGLVGQRAFGNIGAMIISNSHAQGRIQGDDEVGGLIGSDAWAARTENCFAAVDIGVRNGTGSSGPYFGFLVGRLYDPPVGQPASSATVVIDSYYLQESSCSACVASEYGRGLSLSAMKSRDSFSSWDFQTPKWLIHDGVSLPILVPRNERLE
ncbi:MAG: hypothetical protein NDI61_09105 [Bdellovibrionaceae bacterium]|nr:hypothetical protein [Pseudobdellovibrionaceae bacterium]